MTPRNSSSSPSPSPSPSLARDIATETVHRVIEEDAYSHIVLDAALKRNPHLDDRDRRLATELAYGTLTYKGNIDAILSRFIDRKQRKRLDPDVENILRVATYQIVYLDRVPVHAAVDEAVKATKRAAPGRRGAPGFVNAVLRNIDRQRDRWPDLPDLEARPVHHLSARYALPRWLIRRWIDRFGLETASAIAASTVARPGVTMRAPQNQRDALIQTLPGATATSLSPQGLHLTNLGPDAMAALIQATVVVQDEAAQLVALLADPRPDERVLDACAGLGGKTLHLAELMGSAGAPSGSLTAVEPNASKLELLARAFADRPHLLTPDVLTSNLDALPIEGDGALFDLIVIDAPCTGLGLLARHPETRWRKSERDIEALAAIQTGLLDDAVARLSGASGARIVYSVCTTTVEEGPQQIRAFLRRHPEFTIDPDGHRSVPWHTLPKEPDDSGYTLLPHQFATDGFFLAKLKRIAP